MYLIYNFKKSFCIMYIVSAILLNILLTEGGMT